MTFLSRIRVLIVSQFRNTARLAFSKGNLFLTIVSVFLLYKAPFDPDMWWHIKYGQLILYTKNFPLKDLFSYPFEGYEWASSYWLPQVSMAMLNSIGGPFLVSLVFSLVLAVYVVWFVRLYGFGFYSSLFAVLTVSLGFSSYGVTIRPMLFSCIFMLALWGLLTGWGRVGPVEESEEGAVQPAIEPRLLLIPLLFLMWVNFHADFIVGLGVLLTYVVFESFLSFRERHFLALRRILFLFLIMLSSGLATLVNPYSLNLHKTLFNDVYNIRDHNTRILEFKPTPIQNPNFLLSVGATLVFITVFYKKGFSVIPEKAKLLYGTALVVTLILGFASHYFFRFFYIYALPYFLCFADMAVNYARGFRWLKVGSVHLKFVLGFLLFFSFCNFMVGVLTTLEPRLLSKKMKLPYAAVEFVNKTNPDGNMLNFYNWGGFLIGFAPQYKVFTDGRMASWNPGGVQVLDLYHELVFGNDSEKLQRFIDEHGVGWSIFPVESGVNSVLQKELGWKVVYRDDIAIVLTKSSKDLTN